MRLHKTIVDGQLLLRTVHKMNASKGERDIYLKHMLIYNVGRVDASSVTQNKAGLINHRRQKHRSEALWWTIQEARSQESCKVL